MIIAVDADGTLFTRDRYPRIGEENSAVVDALIKRKEAGDKIILWTCRESKNKDMVVRWAAKRGLEFDAVNSNVKNYKHAKRKIVADIYVDDRAMRPDEFIEVAFDYGRETPEDAPVEPEAKSGTVSRE